ncbi:tRNA (adenosine(37)-N6)-dimethylallyltransferase MiaA [Lujinxingia litoralis]|uniref:tRNA dimethylallyltransferase n=1 Tax=Lujinxingia litoralis TaxID=2211119 RepID=A0A328C9L3_9DELT|nr:tRNA (adenosine(37)-N6)-dimethylallyltransferase MiaA [Lujinxingia litoralis]RAL21660.1 tRNA (adenosine(37)-N6)-dimethylallyltransferase MiaA [Lujinxingia litoralis]
MMEFADTPESYEGLTRIIALVGPTGVGKTAFSLALAEALNAEIVSVDSLQVYRYLDIGTAKASREERARVPHHLIDVVNPDEDFNAADFRVRASEAIESIVARGKVPLLVGGTGLYVRLLVHGLFEAPPPSEALRARYRALADEQGEELLYERLKDVDPELAARVHANDFVRVTRGLEIFDQTGIPLSEHQRRHRFQKPHYHALKIALIRPRPELYERINQRVDQMVALGLEEEYRELLARGYGPQHKPMQSLGYRQMGEHLLQGRPLEEAIQEIKQQTRRYAKQQISWFRGEPQTHWAMAPLLRAGALPEVIERDLRSFVGGGKPALEWAQIDPYNVERA